VKVSEIVHLLSRLDPSTEIDVLDMSIEHWYNEKSEPVTVLTSPNGTTPLGRGHVEFPPDLDNLTEAWRLAHTKSVVDE
jgi:hypothetical protein